MDSESLIDQIEEAFSKLRYPGDHDLTVHPLGLDEEFYEALIGKGWRNLDSTLLNYHSDCIGVLTPNGFRHFIAAFLIESLKNDTSITGHLIWDFSEAISENSSPIKNLSGDDWFNDRMAALSEEQRSCLAAYFLHQRASEFEEEQAKIDLVVEEIRKI